MLKIFWIRSTIKQMQKKFTIQKEKSSLIENYQSFYNFQDDIKSLSEFISTDNQEKQLECQLTSQFFQQFALLFNNVILLHIFKLSTHLKILNKKSNQQIKILNLNQWIQKLQLLSKFIIIFQKTPSLNSNCQKHYKEIIMINIDTKNKKMEDRFVFVDCISDHPNCQYTTIEKVNQELNYAKNQQDLILIDFKAKNLEKYEELLNKLPQYNEKKLQLITQ
ncbi:unnamed protein product [Paramecium pentaurelia]|uniref:Uncharacterized protein n=1 Tax=Paramecium pentaurelia TaxID=43138 RepID=A0A8S1XSI0_9CILI|nr:unnamed protein product [Paramecium pentaurelia]